MEKLFVSYEISLRLKELGFDEPCLGKYCSYNDGDPIELYPESQNFFKGPGFQSQSNSYYIEQSVDKVAAPTYQQVTDWLRDKHNIDLWVEKYSIYGDRFYWQCPVLNDVNNKYDHWGDTYYESLPKGIEVVLTTL